ncbi:MAG: MaoC family dehydratase [Cyclobacteriaceae bacterium]|nr:MaoC family dehydratase [Cyclobacteriaceae bacterium HetDA_MAG_MS6]
MSKITITGFEDFKQYEGKELGQSEFLGITQDQINQFADATLDHQWIHTDPDRAAKEGGFGGPIAHGYLTLSIVPHLWNQIIEVHNLKMMINYGIEKLKFNQPVMVDQEVRLHAKLQSLMDLRGITKAEVSCKLEIKDNPKPAFQATVIFLYHFE